MHGIILISCGQIGPTKACVMRREMESGKASTFCTTLGKSFCLIGDEMSQGKERVNEAPDTTCASSEVTAVPYFPPKTFQWLFITLETKFQTPTVVSEDLQNLAHLSKCMLLLLLPFWPSCCSSDPPPNNFPVPGLCIWQPPIQIALSSNCHITFSFTSFRYLPNFTFLTILSKITILQSLAPYPLLCFSSHPISIANWRCVYSFIFALPTRIGALSSMFFSVLCITVCVSCLL